MDFHTTRVQVARKQHTCRVTGLPINPGDRYMRYVGVYEGDFYSVRVLMGAARAYEKQNHVAWRSGEEGLAWEDTTAAVLNRLDDNPTHEDIRDASDLMRTYPETHAYHHNLQLALRKAVEDMNNRPT